MSWADPDVTPLGASPFRHRRGWGRVALGLVLIVGGVVALALGIVNAVNARERIESEAVARGVFGEPLSFTASEPGDYTVFHIFGGRIGNDTVEERAIRDSVCTVAVPGDVIEFRGNRQSVSLTLGRASSVGEFATAAGEVTIVCDYVRERLGRPGTHDYVVTAGAPGLFGDIAMIIGGAFALVLGILALVWGLIGKRVPA